MAFFEINGQQIEYDATKQYLVVGVVGSGHGGDHFGLFLLDNSHYFKRLNQRSQLPDFKPNLEGNLSDMIDCLDRGVFDKGSDIKDLNLEEKPALERGIDLYTRILSVLR